MRCRVGRLSWLLVTVALALLLTQPTFVAAAGNPLCPGEDVFFNPGNGEDIVVPQGFKVSVFKSGLNFPTAVAFRGNSRGFEVFVLESGHGLPSRCNDETSATVGGEFSPTNPFTPDILVFDERGNQIGKLAKPTANGGLLPHGPAIDIAFEKAALVTVESINDLRLQPEPPHNRQQQQLTHRDRQSRHRERFPVHHRPSHGGPPGRADHLQRRLDLLVPGVDDQLGCGLSRQRRRREPA